MREVDGKGKIGGAVDITHRLRNHIRVAYRLTHHQR